MFEERWEIVVVFFSSNMTRQMPVWYVKEQNIFETMTRDHPRIEVVRVPGGSVQLNARSQLSERNVLAVVGARVLTVVHKLTSGVYLQHDMI